MTLARLQIGLTCVIATPTSPLFHTCTELSGVFVTVANNPHILSSVHAQSYLACALLPWTGSYIAVKTFTA